jgi:hypothetical protein
MAQIGAKMKQARNFKRLNWQPAPHGTFDAQRLFGALSNLRLPGGIASGLQMRAPSAVDNSPVAIARITVPGAFTT